MVPLRNITTGQLLRDTAARFPQRPAARHCGKTLTYAALEQETEYRAKQLLALGIRRGDQVALLGEAGPDLLCLFYATALIGAVAVMVNTAYTARDLETLLSQTDTKLLLIGHSFKSPRHLTAMCRDISPALLPKAVRTFGDAAGDCFPALDTVSIAKITPWQLMVAEAAVTPEDTAVLFQTSGSTGPAKLVMTSHYARTNNGIQQAADLGITEEDVFCVTVPMFHCFCISANVMAALACGACLSFPADRHTASIAAAIETDGCTILNSVPTMFKALLSKPQFPHWKLDTLRTGIIGGAYYPPEDFVEIEQKLGMTLMSSLGQTECTAGLTVSRRDDPLALRSTTVGHFMDHVEGKIAHITTGQPLAVGQVGELCVRGYLTMQGYYNRPDLTAKVMDADGWLHTGDMGFMDADGNITLTGRIKELIIRGGENINPGDIQHEILLLPQIRDCRVVPIPDKHYGEEICAIVQLEQGAACTEADIAAHLEGRLPAFKLPAVYLFWDSFPRTANGKISPSLCAKKAAEQLGLPTAENQFSYPNYHRNKC